MQQQKDTPSAILERLVDWFLGTGRVYAEEVMKDHGYEAELRAIVRSRQRSNVLEFRGHK